VRRFIVLGHEAHTSPDFSLDDIPGTSGRIDVLARCATAAFLLSHGIRKDVELNLVLCGPPRPPRTIRMAGAELKHLNPDERSTAALFIRALQIESIVESMSTPGVYVSGMGFDKLLEMSEGPFILLKEDGEDVRNNRVPKDAVFVLSDHLDFTEDEEMMLMAYDPTVLSLGPRSLHADQCITLVHNELDRREASL
jgi:tRNA (pseudouridine54-N1)-methyltransferase